MGAVVSASPLVMTADPALWAQVDRVAAASSVSVDRSTGVASTGVWRRASVVVVDAALVEATAAAMSRRDDVVVVASGEMSDAQWEACLALRVQEVLTLPKLEDGLIRILADAGDTASAGGDGRILAVIGACGGAGATVLAAAAALAAASTDRSVLLCDVDLYGAGLDVTMGVENAGGAHWGDIAASRGRLPVEALHRALPNVPGVSGRLSIVGHRRSDDSPVDADLLETVLDAVVRAGDTAVVDVPRSLDAAADRVLARADLTALVVPADVRGCYAAARALPRLTEVDATVGLVVRGPSPGGIGASDIADALNLPLAAVMRPQPGLERSLDAGKPPGRPARSPLGRAARAVLRHMEQRRQQQRGQW